MKFLKKINKLVNISTSHTYLIVFVMSFFLLACNSNPSSKIRSESSKSESSKSESSKTESSKTESSKSESSKSESSKTESSKSESSKSEITFKKDVIEYGNVFEGQVVEEVFKFTNTGNSNLIIYDAKPSCGCTVPKYPKNKNIKPGESGEIMVRFNTEGRVGPGIKTVTLTTNAGNKIIRINGNVLKR